MEAQAATEASPVIHDATPDKSGAGEGKQSTVSPQVDLKAKVKAKIYDKEEEVSIEDLVKTYQTERAAQKKFERAAEIERKAKEVERQHADLKKKLKDNFWDVAKENGYDPDEIAEQRLLKKLEFEMMNDDQKKAFKLQKDLEEREAKIKFYEQEENTRKEQLAKQQTEALKLQHIQEIDDTLAKVLKERNLKPSPAILESVAQYMLAHLNSEKGNKDITALEALEYVLGQSEKEFLARIEATPTEELIKKLPKATLDAIRKHFVNQVTSGQVKPQKADSTPRNGAKKQYKGSTDSFFDKLEQKFG